MLPTPPAMLVVKKYPNRRLYDTAESRYITLEDLAERIKGGTDVRVLDVQSGADLTQATLMQIILESRGAARLLPVPVLLRLIRLGDEALAEFFGRYVSWALELYVQARHGARSLIPLNPLATAPFAATDALARLVLGATQWGKGGGSSPIPPMPVPEAPYEPPFDPAPEPPVEHASSVPPSSPPWAEAPAASRDTAMTDVTDEMARMRRELEALKRSMGAATRAAARTPKKKARTAKAPKA